MQVAKLSGTAFTFKRADYPTPPQMFNPRLEEIMGPLNSMTRWELQVHLATLGKWTDCMCHSKRKLEPLTPDLLRSLEEKEEKQYFFDQYQLPKEYLMCIFLLPRLFEQGLDSFYHFQLKSYYIALLDFLQHKKELLGDLLPNQPAVYYKEKLANPKRSGKRKQGGAGTTDASRKVDLACDSDIEEDISLRVHQRLSDAGSALPKTKRQRARGRGRGRGQRDQAYEQEIRDGNRKSLRCMIQDQSKVLALLWQLLVPLVPTRLKG
ncbi:Uncharacterized protein SCF082_LOCUS24851 [Durusdinium trenchii]|uniref:MRG domain-containing protein n=1 Tax=Durusdinium trenchii TaxID=1381693 RepID=A0ABP0LWB5_9DINO